MSTVWFTADTHFWHSGILKWHPDTRPFDDVERMNEEIILRWNKRVMPGDVVYHVGDFAFGAQERSVKILKRLNGGINLVCGNHDKTACGGLVKKHLNIVKPLHEIRIEGQKIILCHYAMRVWNEMHRGSWQLYGHSHGSLPDDRELLSIDVGMDCHKLAPISFAEVKRLMSHKRPVAQDHHDGDFGGRRA